MSVGICTGCPSETLSSNGQYVDTHLHNGTETENMTQVSLDSILDNENVDRVMYPSGEQVDLAAIKQHAHCQVTRIGWLH